MLLFYKSVPRNHGEAKYEHVVKRGCEIDDATLLINARNWHFQRQEIENVAG